MKIAPLYIKLMKDKSLTILEGLVEHLPQAMIEFAHAANLSVTTKVCLCLYVCVSVCRFVHESVCSVCACGFVCVRDLGIAFCHACMCKCVQCAISTLVKVFIHIDN